MQLLNPKLSRSGCCGCLTLALLLLIILCILAAVGVFALTRTANASSDVASRHVVLLIDHSNSIAQSPRSRTLAQAAARAVIGNLQASPQPGDRLSVLFFGSRAVPVMTGTLLSDASIMPRLNTAFDLTRPLGGTDLLGTLSATLRLSKQAVTAGVPRVTDVVLVSDGVPEPLVSTLHAAYQQRLREMAATYARRGITLSVLLIRSATADHWRGTWADMAALAHGRYAEVDTAKDGPVMATEVTGWIAPVGTITAMATATSTSTSTSTAPMPTTTPTPTPHRAGAAVVLPTQKAMPSPTTTPPPPPSPLPTAQTLSAVATGMPVVTAMAPQTPAVPEDKGVTAATPLPAWALAGAGALVLVGVLVAGRRRRSRAERATSFPADEGVLEIYDPETDEVERVELRAMELGEVWLLGSGPQCPIHLQCTPASVDGIANACAQGNAGWDEREHAALILGHDGPRVESRGAPLYFEGRRVLTHRLFDGDHLYLDRFVLYYHNFFRQRALVEEEDRQQTTDDRHLTPDT